MPEKLPKLVELLISRTPEVYKPAVAHAIFPPLATHLWKTSFRYIDNVEHEATLMTCLLAGTGAGKRRGQADRYHYGGYQEAGCGKSEA